MPTFEVTAFLNTSRDNFSGYAPGDLLATAYDLEFTVVALTIPDAAEQLFLIGNRMGTDMSGAAWPHDVRTLSKGDVVKVTPPAGLSIHLSVDSAGFTPIPEPTIALVPINGFDRLTSRSDKE